jgi:uncharacterized protein
VRLCDVAPSGASLFLAYGLLNLTHRESHEYPSPLEPGERYIVNMRLTAVGCNVPAGHRLRVAVSPTYWPHAWPSPEPVTLSVFTGGQSELRLPKRPSRPEDDNVKPFEPAEGSAQPAFELIPGWPRESSVVHDHLTGRFTTTTTGGRGWKLPATGLDYRTDSSHEHIIIDGDPLSAAIRYNCTIRIERGEWRTRVETTSSITSDLQNFRVTQTLDAYEGNTRIFARTWTFEAPRDNV